MPADEHRAHAPRHVRLFVVTVSDTRTPATDVGGETARTLCAAAGHEVVGSRIIKDDATAIAALVEEICAAGTADAVVLTGGTGLSARDTTYEALVPLLEKRLDGFGELFRTLSFQEIGAAAMLSRAVAGLRRGVLVFAIPGSPAAVRLALERLILPEVGHAVAEVRR